jgi:hypothetical protein
MIWKWSEGVIGTLVLPLRIGILPLNGVVKVGFDVILIVTGTGASLNTTLKVTARTFDEIAIAQTPARIKCRDRKARQNVSWGGSDVYFA